MYYIVYYIFVPDTKIHKIYLNGVSHYSKIKVLILESKNDLKMGSP